MKLLIETQKYTYLCILSECLKPKRRTPSKIGRGRGLGERSGRNLFYFTIILRNIKDRNETITTTAT